MMRTIADTKPTRPPKNPGRSFRKMANAIDKRELKKAACLGTAAVKNKK